MTIPPITTAAPPDRVDFSGLRRVLVVKLRHHGDVLLTSPLFRVLKNHHPHLEVDALVYGETQEMLSLHPDIDHLFMIDRGWKRLGTFAHLARERELLSELKERRYDLILHLTESWRGAWLARLLRPSYAVTPRVTRRTGSLWRNSFTHHYPQPAGQRHTVEKHLDALRRIGLQPTRDERRLILVPGEQAEASVKTMLGRLGLLAGAFVHLHPTSRWLFKCWTEEKMAELIDRLQAAGHPVVVTAAPIDRELAMVRRILAAAKSTPHDLSGQLNMKELAALTAQAGCFTGVDSVPMHIAAAVGTPTVALFGPSGDREWGPWQVAHRVITHEVSCRPCGLDGCGGGKVSECLTAVEVDAVFAGVMELLGR